MEQMEYCGIRGMKIESWPRFERYLEKYIAWVGMIIQTERKCKTRNRNKIAEAE